MFTAVGKLVEIGLSWTNWLTLTYVYIWTNWLKYVYLWTNWLKFVYLWTNWLKRVKPANILAETSLPGPGKTFKIGSPRDKRDETGLPG